MNGGTLLHILIAVHTLIAAATTFGLFYLYYAAWKRRRPGSDKVLLFALVWPLIDWVLLSVNGNVCPLQNAAQALTGEHGHWVRDMYWIPESWLKLVPWTFGPSYVFGAALVWWRGRRKPISLESAPPQRRA